MTGNAKACARNCWRTCTKACTRPWQAHLPTRPSQPAPPQLGQPLPLRRAQRPPLGWLPVLILVRVRCLRISARVHAHAARTCSCSASGDTHRSAPLRVQPCARLKLLGAPPPPLSSCCPLPLHLPPLRSSSCFFCSAYTIPGYNHCPLNPPDFSATDCVTTLGVLLHITAPYRGR